MAILAPFRFPQPPAFMSYPGSSAAAAGVGWSVPHNPGNFANILFYSKNFGASAFRPASAAPGPAPLRPGNYFAIPARWGRLRGILAYYNPVAP